MIDAAALSTTKMNPPETSQSKKFRRKKRSSFQSMTFLWLSHIFFTALLLFWNWKTSLPPKKQLQGYEDWLLTIGQWTTFPMTLKLSFKVNTWLAGDCNLDCPKRLLGLVVTTQLLENWCTWEFFGFWLGATKSCSNLNERDFWLLLPISFVYAHWKCIVGTTGCNDITLVFTPALVP